MADEADEADEKEVKGKARPGRRPKTGRSSSSKAADARWTLRGVSGVTRSLAVEAAEKRGMTIGDWVSEAIVQNFQPDKNGSADATNALGIVHTPSVANYIADIEERLTALERERGKGLLSRLFRR